MVAVLLWIDPRSSGTKRSQRGFCMTGLVQFALSHLRHEHPFTVLDAAAADGSALVALADRLGMEARYAGLELPELGQRVLSRLRGADDEDRMPVEMHHARGNQGPDRKGEDQRCHRGEQSGTEKMAARKAGLHN